MSRYSQEGCARDDLVEDRVAGRVSRAATQLSPSDGADHHAGVVINVADHQPNLVSWTRRQCEIRTWSWQSHLETDFAGAKAWSLSPGNRRAGGAAPAGEFRRRRSRRLRRWQDGRGGATDAYCDRHRVAGCRGAPLDRRTHGPGRGVLTGVCNDYLDRGACRAGGGQRHFDLGQAIYRALLRADRLRFRVHDPHDGPRRSRPACRPVNDQPIVKPGRGLAARRRRQQQLAGPPTDIEAFGARLGGGFRYECDAGVPAVLPSLVVAATWLLVLVSAFRIWWAVLDSNQ